MKCSTCGTYVPLSSRLCPGCSADAGFPNVKLAETIAEKEALSKRLKQAETSSEARDCLAVLRDFGVAAGQSKVVITRSLQRVDDIVRSENTLYVSFYKESQSGARLPEENAWDKGRYAADSTVSPHYFQDLVDGALSIDGKGVPAFGPYSIVLREPMIERRATVFEENPFTFCKRHRIAAGQETPAGYRAIWEERQLLAMAKLHSELTSATTRAQYPGIVLKATPKGNEDFIEVHIYGPIHRAAIERVIGPRPNGGPQLVIWRSVESKLKSLGARMEVG